MVEIVRAVLAERGRIPALAKRSVAEVGPQKLTITLTLRLASSLMIQVVIQATTKLTIKIYHNTLLTHFSQDMMCFLSRVLCIHLGISGLFCFG